MIPISPKSAASKGTLIRLSASVFLLIINMIYILSLRMGRGVTLTGCGFLA
jgi:hypothetical protein